MSRYVALLRGINVGGRNPVAMSALKAFFEAEGFRDVATYIQSGNVLFSATEPAAALAARLEAGLSTRFGYAATVVVRSREQLRRIVEGAPAGFGARPALYRYDVIFLKEPLSSAEAIAVAPVNPDVDRVAAGPGVLYYARLVRLASRSRMSRIVSLPIYARMTIRNWNTTTRLLALLERDAPEAARPARAPRGPRRAPRRTRPARRRAR